MAPKTVKSFGNDFLTSEWILKEPNTSFKALKQKKIECSPEPAFNKQKP